MTETDSDLESLYRFFKNKRVKVEKVLEPHYRQTAEKCGEQQVVRVIHDTSDFHFGGEKKRDGLGRAGTRRKEDGFAGHFALAAEATRPRTPLGLLSFQALVLEGPPKKDQVGEEEQDNPKRKSAKWAAGVEAVEARLKQPGLALHLFDREADDYKLWEQLRPLRWIGRCRLDRLVKYQGVKRSLWEAVALAQPKEGQPALTLTREVALSARGQERTPAQLKLYPPREARQATLTLWGLTVTMLCPKRRKDCQTEELETNIVVARELNPPKGEEPMEWILLTNEDISTPEALAAVVDHYCARWLIEEFFKALKTGCAYEARQLESLHALLNALGLLAPLAVELLLLRNHCRDFPDAPASRYFSPSQLTVLALFSKRHRLPENPTILQATFALAGLGGHLKRNGLPGWLTLFRGRKKLALLEQAWLLARSVES